MHRQQDAWLPLKKVILVRIPYLLDVSEITNTLLYSLFNCNNHSPGTGGECLKGPFFAILLKRFAINKMKINKIKTSTHVFCKAWWVHWILLYGVKALKNNAITQFNEFPLKSNYEPLGVQIYYDTLYAVTETGLIYCPVLLKRLNW